MKRYGLFLLLVLGEYVAVVGGEVCQTIAERGGTAFGGVDEAGSFRPGDCRPDGSLDLSDAVTILQYLFVDGYAQVCEPLCDVDGNGELELADPILLVEYLYKGGVPPRAELRPDESIEDCNIPVRDTVTVQVCWDPVTHDVEGYPEVVARYWVHVGNRSGEYDASWNAYGASCFRVHNLTPATTYYLAVSAEDVSGNESELSEELIFTTPQVIE